MTSSLNSEGRSARPSPRSKAPRGPSLAAGPRLSALVAALALSACAHVSQIAPAPQPPAAPAPAPYAPPAPAAEPAVPEVAPGPPPELPLVVAAAGDVMMGTTFPDETGGGLPPEDGALLFAEVAPIFHEADVAFANLEGPLVEGGTSEKCARSKPGRCYAFRTPPRYAAHLREAGLSVVSLANNHASDFGEAGRASTRLALDLLGLRYTGAPGEVARLEVRGTRVAVVAFSTSGGQNDLRDLAEAGRVVSEAAASADVVIVSMHGGAEGAGYQHVPPGKEEFLGEDRGDLRAFARAVIAAGADLVIGHGPHVVRGMEVVAGRLVAYSLGNFCTYGGMNLSGPNGLTLVLEVRLAKDGGFLGGRIHPGRQERPGGPRLDPAGEVIRAVRELSQADFGASAVSVGEDGTLSAPAAIPPG